MLLLLDQLGKFASVSGDDPASCGDGFDRLPSNWRRSCAPHGSP